MILLFIPTRTYSDWCISLLTQEDSCHRLLPPFTRLSCLKLRHNKSLYHKSLYSQIDIETSDILLPNTLQLSRKLSSYFSSPSLSPTFLQSSLFDLYGRLLPFDTSFSPSGDSVKYSSKFSRFFITKFSMVFPPFNLFFDFIFIVLRLVRLFRFK